MGAHSVEAADFEIDSTMLRDLTVDLVNIPSPPGSEESVALFLQQYFTDMGLKTWTQEVEPGRRNVVGVLRGAVGGPTLMLLGHLDTVWGGDEEGIRELGPGFQPRAVADGDWIYGMGAYNMKSGLAAAIAGVRAVIASGRRLRGTLVVAGVVGETARCQVDRYQGARYRGGGVGAWHLVTNGTMADMAIIAEPTHFRVSIASGGYVYFRLSTRGVPGATYRRGGARLGVAEPVDALNGMLALREAVLKWGAQYAQAHPYQGQVATNVSIIGLDSGLPFRPTKVPSFARMYVEVGTMPDQRAQDVIEEFSAMVNEAAETLGIDHVEVDLLQAIGPAEISPEEFVVGAVARAHRQVMSQEPEITFDGWMADTTALTRAGIPALCYGPAGRMRQGGAGYYAADGEQCYLPDLVLGAKVYASAALDVCSRDRREVLAGRSTD